MELLMNPLWAMAMVVAAILFWAEMRRRQFTHIPSLKGKHVVITGASSGIGFCAALQCAAEGACVTLMDASLSELQEAGRKITSSPGIPADALLLKAVDITDAGAMAAAMRQSFEWRPIDVLLCAAALSEFGLIEDVKASRMEDVVRTNVLGLLFPIQAVIPFMRARSNDHPCSIVILSTLASCVFHYGSNVYSATRAAQKGLAEYLKFELLPHGIGVTLCCPAFTHSPMLSKLEEEGAAFLEVGKKIYWRIPEQSAEEVARRTIEGFKRNEFFVITSFHGFLTRVIGRGFVPPDSISLLLAEFLFIAPARIVSYVWATNAKRVLLALSPSKKTT